MTGWRHADLAGDTGRNAILRHRMTSFDWSF